MNEVEPVAVARLCFEGALLRRGFWLYVWKIRQNSRLLVYVGRTGDSASSFASSPFSRAGQHLDLKEKAKANALVRQLRSRGIDPIEAEYELIALGPFAPEAVEREGHWPLRDKFAALETALGRELQARGYDLIGSHNSKKPLDQELFSRVLTAIEAEFHSLHKVAR